METLILVVLIGMLGLILGSQFAHQPTQVTVVQVQPDDTGRGGGCAPLIAGILIFVALVWFVSLVPQS